VINTLVRPADSKDHQQLSNLIFFETRLHRHLDWHSPLDWLGGPFFWALDEGGRITAAMACPAEAPRIAWIRLFVHGSHWSAENAWTLLWHTAKRDIALSGGASVAAIAMQSWFHPVLLDSGFNNTQRIVMLEWRYQPLIAFEADGVQIRKMTDEDLPDVEKIDASAFDPLWHNPRETLRTALSQALSATVVEGADGILGYQLTTGGEGRAHLARLAVHPSAQGRAIGRFLVGDLLKRLTNSGIVKLSVNTQSDNASSLALYKKMGFVRTGEEFPVDVFVVEGYV